MSESLSAKQKAIDELYQEFCDNNNIGLVETCEKVWDAGYNAAVEDAAKAADNARTHGMAIDDILALKKG